MLKIIHFSIGATALLIGIIAALKTVATGYFNNTDAIYLALFGLFNILIAPTLQPRPDKRQILQWGTSVFLILPVVLQILPLLIPQLTIMGIPTVFFSVTSLMIAAILQSLLHTPAGRTPVPIMPTYKEGNGQQTSREVGIVKWFNTSKGFGFISRHTGEDIFVHFRAIRGEGHRILTEGQRVEFSVIQKQRGLQAEDVVAAE